MKRALAFLIGFLFLSGAVQAGEEKLRVVATTSLLASLTEEIAGPYVEIHTVASPRRDLHTIEPTPVDVLKVKKADLLVHHGVQAEPWLAALLHAGGNRQLFEPDGSVDTSLGIEILEKPVKVSRIEGDVHPGGNPHYWTDPENAVRMIENIMTGLAKQMPGRRAELEVRAAELTQRIEAALVRWRAALKPYHGQPFISYHRNWIYFAKQFGLEAAGEIETKPGIPPTARHLADLMRRMKEKEIRVVITEPYYESRTSEKLVREAGGRVVKMLQFPGGRKGTGDYIRMMDWNIQALAEGFQSPGKGES